MPTLVSQVQLNHQLLAVFTWLCTYFHRTMHNRLSVWHLSILKYYTFFRSMLVLQFYWMCGLYN